MAEYNFTAISSLINTLMNCTVNNGINNEICLEWLGHIIRMNETRTVKRFLRRN
jgi:hypothetical protein